MVLLSMTSSSVVIRTMTSSKFSVVLLVMTFLMVERAMKYFPIASGSVKMRTLVALAALLSISLTLCRPVSPQTARKMALAI